MIRTPVNGEWTPVNGECVINMDEGGGTKKSVFGRTSLMDDPLVYILTD